MSIRMTLQIQALEKLVEELRARIEALEAPTKPVKGKGRKEGTLHLNG